MIPSTTNTSLSSVYPNTQLLLRSSYSDPSPLRFKITALLASKRFRAPALTISARCSSPGSTDSTALHAYTSAIQHGVRLLLFGFLVAGILIACLVNHFAIFRNVGIEPVEYPYYDPKTIGLDYNGFIGALREAPTRSVFLLHACAHNPTGVDPTEEQWEAIADVMLEKKHYAFFDCAYQGFASGGLDKDAWAVRRFVDRGVALLVCQVRNGSAFVAGMNLTRNGMQSFAKNAGLYGERVGALHVVSADKETADRVRSQLSVLQRSEISNPPSHGARLVSIRVCVS